VYFEVGIRGPAADLHSGVFGGIVRNPAVVLSELIAGLHDKDGRVTLEGFYDKVRKLTKEEREEIAANGPTDEEWRKMAGVKTLYGEKGYTSTERVGARPTLEVNGMISGFTGTGMKTVIGAAAMAKISTRTVPYQDPSQIEASMQKYFARNMPEGFAWELKKLVDGPYSILERGTPELEAASRALEITYKKKPFMKLEGGSVPLVAIIKNRLGLNTVNLGCGISDAHIHSPNERLHLPTYFKGIETYVRFFDLVGTRN
jgi:acetylornithine deacetylase/succinyl-diaminopimelate desuccinylase-like protein